jgi:septal ring factor EnvC (AmiA/AmiB activator)
MWNKVISFFDSLIIHFFLLVILFLSLTLPDMPAPQKNTVLDEKQVQAEIERLKREQAFESMTQQSQEYALEQNKTDYEQLMEQEALHLDVLRQQLEVERQELEAITQRSLNEKAALDALLRDKEALKEDDKPDRF